MKANDGKTYTRDEDLLKIAADFYDQLYDSKNVLDEEIDKYLNKITIEHKLSEKDKCKIEGKITYKECRKVVQQLKLNRCPGQDGLCAEFFKKFWHKLEKILVDSFNESYDDGQLSESQRKAVISLIFKKGDAELLVNYRPISITSVDYKILAFCLANRMQKVIKSIISTSQVAYIKDRFIGCNIRLVQDIMEYCDSNDQGAVLMMLDFCKAYDSLEWNFLFKVLERFNFGNSFIRWIKTLYNNPVACIKNNGHLSRDIILKRSIRQGCPVSVLLFILAAEVMAIAIRQSDNVKGIKVKDTNHSIKILQYADDGVLFLNDENEMRSAIEIINMFGKFAGTLLNMNKCEGLWIGTYKERQNDCKLFNIKWPLDPIRCLGIYIGHNKKENETLNWSSKLEKIQILLNRWKQRKLTIFGKVLIIKQLAIPKVLFSASNLTVPENFVKQLDALFYDFIWGKTEKVKRSVMVNQLEKGGVKMIDTAELFKSVKAAWVPRLLNASDSDLWTMVARYYLKYHSNSQLVFKMNCTGKCNYDLVNNIPIFYKEVLHAYNQAKHINIDMFCDNILDQCIWGNDFITCKDKGKKHVLYYKRWIDVGILKVNNLRFVNGILDENFIYTKVVYKTNILAEVSKLKIALRPYRQYIGDHEPVQDDYLPLFYNKGKAIDQFKDTKSKIFYNALVSCKVTSPTKETKWKEALGVDEINFKDVYTKKIIKILDRKLAEFNFKILHDILPCNVNLVRWKKIANKECRLCNVEETIQHLLFECTFAKAIWLDLKHKIGLDVSVKDIVLGGKLSESQNVLVTIVAYYIYKCWLLECFNNVRRHNVNISAYLTELRYRYNSYICIGQQSIVEAIGQVIMK